MAEKFQVRRTCFMFTIQVDIYGNHPTLIPVAAETKCSYGTELLFLAEHDRAHIAKARLIGAGSAEVVYRGFLHLQYFVQQVSALPIAVDPVVSVRRTSPREFSLGLPRASRAGPTFSSR